MIRDFCGRHPPNGFIGALRRIHGVLREPRHYALLLEVFADPSQRRRQTVLAHCGPITPTKFEIVMRLPEPLLFPEFLASVRNLERAALCADLLAAIRKLEPSLTDDEIHRHAATLDSGSGRERLQHLLRLAEDTPALPFPLDPSRLHHLRSRADFARASENTGTCVRAHFDVALSGKLAFVHVIRQRAVAVLVAVGATPGWVLGRVHAPGNGRMTPQVADAVRAEFREAGVPCWLPYSDPDLAPIGMITHPWDYFALDGDALEGGDLI